MTQTTIGAAHVWTRQSGRTILATKTDRVHCVVKARRQVFELEHMGLPFLHVLENVRIYQRPFGGQSKNLRQARPSLTAPVQPLTVQVTRFLHTLYQAT